ncbi:MAG: hypothetical protein ACM336_02085 [Acidobacteriota bacterium]
MTRTNVWVAIVGLMLCAAFLAAAGAPLGRWECISSAPGGGEVRWTLNVKEIDGKLVCTAGTEDGEVAVDDLKYENNVLTFKVPRADGAYDVTVKFNGDKLDGTWKGNGETGAIKGARKV